MSARQWLDREAPGLNLVGLAEHTDEVETGFGFICVAKDEAQRQAFAAEAEARGALALLVEDGPGSFVPGVPTYEIERLAEERGHLAASFYNEPSRSLQCIGVTGTNGKTSVAYHIADLMNALGHKSGYMGTLGWGTLDELRDPDLTTGNAVALQRRLAALRDDQCDLVALEISSHALDQGRAHSVDLNVALFTNLSRDHLDYHGSMAAYAQAKAKLFSDFPIELAVLNADDAFSEKLSTLADCRVVTYGQAGDWRWEKTAAESGHGALVTWHTPYGSMEVQIDVAADYALANITAALIIAVEMGHSLKECQRALIHLQPVPGRMQVIHADAGQPEVVVDFAHTPDALEKALHAVRQFCVGKLVCILGCGGDRDRGKRAEMGKIAATMADVVWLTSDNPRSEDPDLIIRDMLSGIDASTTEVNVCADRKAAIEAAITNARTQDLVLIAGKGHEAYQEIAGVRLPFSDQDIARQALGGH